MTALPKEQVAPQITLTDIAKECAKKHSDIDKATESALRRLKANRFLYESMVDDLVKSSVRTAIYMARSSINSNLKRPPAKDCPRGADAIIATVGIEAKSLMAWLMPNGKTLGECTREDLAPIAAEYRNQAAGFVRSADFFDAIAEKIPNLKPVEKALTEKDLRKLWDGISGQK